MCTYLDQVSSTYYFRRVVPLELRAFILTSGGAPRSEWKISLRTKDRDEAKRRLPHLTIETDKEIDRARHSLRLGVKPKAGQVQEAPETGATAAARLAGQYAEGQAQATAEAADFGLAEMSAKEERYDARAAERAYWKERFSFSTVDLTPREAAAKDLMAQKDFNAEIAAAEIASLKRALAEAKAAGNPDMLVKAQAAVAPLPALPSAGSSASPSLPLLDLFDDYVKEAGISPVVAQDWKGVLRALVLFLGHDDAARFTVDDIDRWRDTLLAEETKRGGIRSPRTVKERYLSALRSTLNFAVSKRRLSENVAAKVAVRIPRQAKLRDRDFTNAEARAILAATLQPHTDASELTRRARRWIPWLCAYTGSRVNEMSQLRGSDVAQIEGVWTIHITPEAGRVKSGEARTVPLHPHLIEQGFLTFVEEAGSGELFYDPSRVRKPGAANRHVSKVGERLAAWVRATGGITDPNVPPNHGWRHLFKTRALEAGMPERIADAIQGHAARSIGQTYGRVPLLAMYEALSALPRFKPDEGV